VVRRGFFSVAAVLLLFSCGLETYVYLNPVEIVRIFNISRVEISLPSSQPVEFRYYAIYYRIYISDQNATAITDDIQRRNINPALSSHYNTLDSFTSNDNVSPSAIASTFNRLGYYPLHVENGVSLQDVLNNAGGGDVVIDFTDGKSPNMVINSGAPRLLNRAADLTLRPPDRLFMNSNELANSGNVTENSNRDVHTKDGGGQGNYTYVSMYILAQGNDSNWSALYSRPRHIGIFRLPQSTGG
jgi:hypothetical protein